MSIDGDRTEKDPHSLDDTLPPEADAPGTQGDDDWQDEPLETEQLAFANDDVRLPWLETDGDDDDEFQETNTGQLIALLAVGLLAVAVIGGGLWWVLANHKDDVLVADGSVVAAPTQPYKEQPKNPGGKTFAGTGDTSFAVSEGQTRPARLDEKAAPKAPVATPSAKPSAAATAAPSGVGVQVAAYSSRASAEAGWTRLSGQYEALSGLNHRIVEGSADIGTVYRLQVLAGDSSGAHALCNKLKAAGLACQVKN